MSSVLHRAKSRSAWLLAAFCVLCGQAVFGRSAPKQVALPLVLYEEADDPQAPPYRSTGWMGNLDAIEMDKACRDNPWSGETCIRVSYNSGVAWGGVAWLDPANNWGEKAGGYDLRDAEELSFWARGARGGELVEFKIGVKQRGSARYRDTALVKTGKIKLSKEWQRYRVPLREVNLFRVISGFLWVVEGQGEPVTFFLDSIRYEE